MTVRIDSTYSGNDEAPLDRRQILKLGASAGAAALLSSLPAAAAEPAGLAIRRAALRLLEGLSARERERLQLAFDTPQRYRWSYIPGERPGLAAADMAQETRDRAFGLLRAGLSDTGFAKAQGVMSLDSVLRRSTSGPTLRDGEDGYAFAIFGDPAGNAPWGWRAEGHHLSLNYTLIGDETIATTPHCVCADPANVRDGPFTGLAVLDREDHMGRDLARSLGEAQYARAALGGAVPNDILAGPGRAQASPGSGGLSFGELSNETQRSLALAIAETWFSNLPFDLAKRELARLDDTARERLSFQWIGGFDPTDVHYYRLSGPTARIEYSTRFRASHVHAVWRDPENDFGRRNLRLMGYESPPPNEA
jgi:hypothetical protein